MAKVLYLDNFNNFDFFLEVSKFSSDIDMDFIVFNDEKNRIVNSLPFKSYKLKASFLSTSVNELITEEEYRIAIKNDRLLKLLPCGLSIKLMRNYVDQVEKIIDSKSYDLVLGEISWGLEYLVFLLCKRKGIKYRHLLYLPLKTVRAVTFDADHSMSSLAECADCHTEAEFKISYSDICLRVKECFEKGNIPAKYKTIISSDYREWKPLWWLSAFSYHINKRTYAPLYKNSAVTLQEALSAPFKKVLYFPLHVQPESTPDYVSPYYSDQFELIERVSKQLGDEVVILVKEHPNKFSPRSVRGFKRLKKNKNVVFLSLSENAKDIMEKADLVLTIAGTSCLEAANVRKPAIAFSNIYYTSFPGVFDGRQALENNQLKLLVETALKHTEFSDNANGLVEEFGVTGFVHEPMLFPELFEVQNLKAVEDLIIHVCKSKVDS
ncbi:glycosyltransferase [Pseudoalteromonas obscura]|uniref:Glycosyltransferase n=1 Tax=Pseudoalteromonas obscura TaxID=3048491 RepID=A0ABT7ERA0_9GAMM|nr:glycosyltransferase [Pseudoalteromonas sp. P94(2023)]MDK2597589.1 glycosyltransferase [Pseudoalteromonas sp. P94(2023)]